MPHMLTQLLSYKQQVSKERKEDARLLWDLKDSGAREQTVFPGFARGNSLITISRIHVFL